jgi:V/A-type H+-transporting ATPase subunit E
MQDKLQELTDKIYNEGVQRAREDAATLLRQAREQADTIIATAKTDASRMVDEANAKASEIQRNMMSELKMSASQAINSLKQHTTDVIVAEVLQKPVDTLFNDFAFVAELIRLVTVSYLSNGETDLMLILPQSTQQQFDKLYGQSVHDLLQKGITIQYSQQMAKGFKIELINQNYQVSFTDADFVNFFKAYLRPQTYNLLFNGQ